MKNLKTLSDNPDFDNLLTKANWILSEFVYKQEDLDIEVKQKLIFFIKSLDSWSRVSISSQEFTILKNYLFDTELQSYFTTLLPKKSDIPGFTIDVCNNLKNAYSTAIENQISLDVLEEVLQNATITKNIIEKNETVLLNELRNSFKWGHKFNQDIVLELSNSFPKNASYKSNLAYTKLILWSSESALKEAKEILLKAYELSPTNIYVLLNLLYIFLKKEPLSRISERDSWKYFNKLKDLWLEFIACSEPWLLKEDPDLVDWFSLDWKSYLFSELKPVFDLTIFNMKDISRTID